MGGLDSPRRKASSAARPVSPWAAARNAPPCGMISPRQRGGSMKHGRGWALVWHAMGLGTGSAVALLPARGLWVGNRGRRRGGPELGEQQRPRERQRARRGRWRGLRPGPSRVLARSRELHALRRRRRRGRRAPVLPRAERRGLRRLEAGWRDFRRSAPRRLAGGAPHGSAPQAVGLRLAARHDRAARGRADGRGRRRVGARERPRGQRRTRRDPRLRRDGRGLGHRPHSLHGRRQHRRRRGPHGRVRHRGRRPGLPAGLARRSEREHAGTRADDRRNPGGRSRPNARGALLLLGHRRTPATRRLGALRRRAADGDGPRRRGTASRGGGSARRQQRPAAAADSRRPSHRRPRRGREHRHPLPRVRSRGGRGRGRLPMACRGASIPDGRRTLPGRASHGGAPRRAGQSRAP